MNIHTNIPLKNYLTMHLGGNARFMVDAHTRDELATLWHNSATKDIAVVVLGGGSNTLAHDDGFNGMVIRNQIRGIEVVGDTASTTTIKFGGGENWDDAVRFTVERNLSGIEALSAIPGTVGAAPVQNIGAYGQELADTFLELEAYDSVTNSFVVFSADACQFAYRHSIFRGEGSGRYGIVSVTLTLYKATPQPPFYDALQRYFDEHAITIFTPQEVRNGVSAIRSEKLPDPKLHPNTGSFFKNAVIEQWRSDELLKEYPDMPHYDLGNKTFKVPSGWLIEQAGFKGELLHGIRVHDKNSLVLINESASTFSELEQARDEIIGKVRDQFRIYIEQEPLELPRLP